MQSTHGDKVSGEAAGKSIKFFVGGNGDGVGKVLKLKKKKNPVPVKTQEGKNRKNGSTGMVKRLKCLGGEEESTWKGQVAEVKRD